MMAVRDRVRQISGGDSFPCRRNSEHQAAEVGVNIPGMLEEQQEGSYGWSRVLKGPSNRRRNERGNRGPDPAGSGGPVGGV